MRKTGSDLSASCTGASETVSALFLRSDGKVLLGLRASWKRAWADHWDAIGGRVEAGEGSTKPCCANAARRSGSCRRSIA